MRIAALARRPGPSISPGPARLASAAGAAARREAMGRTVSAGRRSRGWEAAAARASPRLRRRPSPPPQASCALGSGGSESRRSPAAGPRLPVWGWRGCGPGPWRGCSARGCGPGPWVPAPGRPVPRNPGGGLRSLRRVAAVPRWPCGAVPARPPGRSVGGGSALSGLACRALRARGGPG